MNKTTLLLGVLALTLLSACGQKETPAPVPVPVPAAVVAPVAAPVAENTAGKSIYGKVCAMCHAAGVAGAPKPGDKAEWAPRIAQGMDVLHKHAIEGFNGAKGQMPARGASTTLTDDEVKSAVAYMVDQSK